MRERIVLGLPLTKSYFSVLVQFLEETEKLSDRMHNIVEHYFYKCVHTYMIEYRGAKVKDNYKEVVRDVAKMDISYLIQSSTSANPSIARFSQNCLKIYV